MRKRDRVLVCDVHGVACFEPEKKAKWKHVNACFVFIQEGTFCHVKLFSFLFEWQVPFHKSASESECKDARGHNLTIGTAQVDTYDKVKCIIEAVSI